jgi:hypothetical protein
LDCNASVGRQNNTQTMGSRDCEKNSPAWDCWKDNVGKKLGGLWFSTTRAGWCDAPHADPSTCTWRVVEAVKRINKTCSNSGIYSGVEKADSDAGKGCFKACPGGTGAHRNVSDSCWINW